MSRRAKHKPEITTSDLGPLIQRERGDLVVLNAPDPDRPNAPDIRRAMRNPQYDRMHRKGDLTDEQRNACDRYAILTERRDGARWVNGERVGGGSHGAHRGYLPEMQVQASAAITTAHKAIGNDAAGLLTLFVIQNQPVDEIAKRRRERPEVAKGRLLAAITRLEEHWSR